MIVGQSSLFIDRPWTIREEWSVGGSIRWFHAEIGGNSSYSTQFAFVLDWVVWMALEWAVSA
jgi:hypothetical protein